MLEQIAALTRDHSVMKKSRQIDEHGADKYDDQTGANHPQVHKRPGVERVADGHVATYGHGRCEPSTGKYGHVDDRLNVSREVGRHGRVLGPHEAVKVHGGLEEVEEADDKVCCRQGYKAAVVRPLDARTAVQLFPRQHEEVQCVAKNAEQTDEWNDDDVREVRDGRLESDEWSSILVGLETLREFQEATDAVQVLDAVLDLLLGVV